MIHLVRQILVLMPRFDREFCHDIPGTQLGRDKNGGAQFEVNLVFNKGLCLN